MILDLIDSLDNGTFYAIYMKDFNKGSAETVTERRDKGKRESFEEV